MRPEVVRYFFMLEVAFGGVALRTFHAVDHAQIALTYGSHVTVISLE